VANLDKCGCGKGDHTVADHMLFMRAAKQKAKRRAVAHRPPARNLCSDCVGATCRLMGCTRSPSQPESSSPPPTT
jgi:hypothetical protein